MMDNIYPKFSIDASNNNIIITEGIYTNTIFKFKRVRFEDDTLKYDVEIIELYSNGGMINNAHESELESFINNEALSVIKRLLKLAKVFKN